MGTARSSDKRSDAGEATREQRAMSGAQILAGVFVLIFVFGLVKSLW